LFGPRIGEAKLPLFATTWWSIVSVFRQVTESFALIVTEAGAKAVRLI
jgi:hypothetical protein